MAQANEAFIEKRIMQFLNPYMDSDSRDLLPPKYEFKMEYDFRPWEVKKVENLVKQIIESNINQIQFVDTNYQLNILPKELSNSAFAKGAQKMHLKEYYLKEYSFVYENDKNLYNSYKDYSVEPTFNVFYPFHFNLAPAAGNMVLLPKPQAVINFIPFFFTEYVAVYEMSLPIIFKIDNNQYDKFSFDFAIEANIDYNSPLIETYEYKLNEEYIETRTQSNSLICDPPQFISEYIYLNISDPIINGERIYDEKKRDFNMPETGVNDAIITFNCKGLSTCFVGETSINGEFIQNNISQLKFRLPIDCNPGRLEIYKYGHKKLIFNNLNPQIETPIFLGTHQMPSKREISLKINILDINKGKFTEGRILEKEENAFLILENLDDREIVEVVEINYENQNNLSIKLLPGNYSINSFLLYNNNINIPGGEICFKT
ncbi:hypothetical protein EOM09_07095, partial [bacterium]|nr:hypothetical protein [bacterium]